MSYYDGFVGVIVGVFVGVIVDGCCGCSWCWGVFGWEGLEVDVVEY